MEPPKDLATAFGEMNTRIDEIVKTLRPIYHRVLDLDARLVTVEQNGIHGMPYSESFLQNAVVLLRKMGTWDTLNEEEQQKFRTMIGKTGELFIGAENKEECEEKGGQWDTDLKRCLRKGVTGEMEKFVHYALPTGFEESDDVKVRLLARKIMGVA